MLCTNDMSDLLDDNLPRSMEIRIAPTRPAWQRSTGARTYLAALDAPWAEVFGRCEAASGIAPFEAGLGAPEELGEIAANEPM